MFRTDWTKIKLLRPQNNRTNREQKIGLQISAGLYVNANMHIDASGRPEIIREKNNKRVSGKRQSREHCCHTLVQYLMSAKPFFVCSQVRLLFEYLHISHYHILISDAIVWLYGCPIPTNMSWNTKTSGWFICTFKHVSCSDKLQKEICTTNLNVIMFIARNCISRKLLNLKYMHIESLKCKMSNTQLYILYSIYLYIIYDKSTN